jgi:hypothetical protein
LSDEDRETIVEIARQSLARFQPKPNPKPKPSRKPKPTKPEAETLSPNARRSHERHHGESAPKDRGAGDLQSVVRTMKAVAASSIGQYEKSVRALADYYRTVELGLGACFRESGRPFVPERKGQTRCAVRSARSCSVQTRDWWASLMMWWPIMRSRRWRLCRQARGLGRR